MFRHAARVRTNVIVALVAALATTFLPLGAHADDAHAPDSTWPRLVEIARDAVLPLDTYGLHAHGVDEAGHAVLTSPSGDEHRLTISQDGALDEFSLTDTGSHTLDLIADSGDRRRYELHAVDVQVPDSRASGTVEVQLDLSAGKLEILGGSLEIDDFIVQQHGLDSYRGFGYVGQLVDLTDAVRVPLPGGKSRTIEELTGQRFEVPVFASTPRCPCSGSARTWSHLRPS